MASPQDRKTKGETVIVRRPRRELMEVEAPPPELVMARDEMPKAGAFDPAFPSELEGLIPHEDWAQIVDRLDEIWMPLFKREQEIESCSMCLCCCCCCTLGLSLCAMCCYSSCAGSGLDKRKVEGRRHMKKYFEEELNPRYSEIGVRFAVSPTIKTFYVEIRVAEPGSPAAEGTRSRTDSSDEEKEGEPLLRRQKENYGNGTSSSTTAADSSFSPAASSPAQEPDVDPSADALDGLD